MSEHDAASVVGGMAGLVEGPPKKKVTPERLIQRFCGQPSKADGVTTYRGHCGYTGGSGDSMKVGFDDGYDFMGYLSERGWRAMPAKGDWPYVVYMVWPGGAGEGKTPILVEYLEADFTLWEFETHDSAKAHYAGLRDCP